MDIPQHNDSDKERIGCSQIIHAFLCVSSTKSQIELITNFIMEPPTSLPSWNWFYTEYSENFTSAYLWGKAFTACTDSGNSVYIPSKPIKGPGVTFITVGANWTEVHVRVQFILHVSHNRGKGIGFLARVSQKNHQSVIQYRTNSAISIKILN